MKKTLLSLATTLAMCGAAFADDYTPIAAEPKPMNYTVSQKKSNIITRTGDNMSRCWDDSSPYRNFFSLRAGANFANLHNDYVSTDSQTGFNAAGLYNIALMDNLPLFLQTGLSFEMKGARNSGILTTSQNTHFKSYNIEIPVVLTFDIPINKSMAIVPEFGVYYSIAVAGSMTTDGGDSFYRPFKSESVTLADGTSIDSRVMSRNDFGLRVGASFRYCRYLIGFAYDAGLINNFSKDLRDLGYKGSTGTWSVNLGYRFNP
ncbi:MAG: outer membrane beta-barrel protein [Rikenellaceae bacterium]